MLALAAPLVVHSEPFIPAEDSQLVERFRERPLDRTDIEFWRSRALLRSAPTSQPLALAVAHWALAIARRDGDRRYLGYAEAALAPAACCVPDRL